MASQNKLAETRVLVIAADGADIGIEGDIAPALKGIGCLSSQRVSSVYGALEIVSDRSQRPSVALVDLGSASDSFDACGMAAQLGDGFSVPVLFTMGRADLGRMNEAIAARPAGYLNKPITADALQKAIADVVPEPVPPSFAKSSPLPPPSLAPPMHDPGDAQLTAPSEAAVAKTMAPLQSMTMPPEPTPLPPVARTEAKAPESSESESKAPEVHIQPKLQPPLSAEDEATPTADAAALADESGLTPRCHQLQGLGYLGRGFAHEFNNLLTVLIGNLSLAQDRYESGVSDEDSELTVSLAAAERARRMVQQLLTFAEGGHPVRDSVRIGDLARAVLTAHREDHPGIFFQFQCSEPDLKVSVDREQVARLLENLVSNAIQAMPEGGTLIVRLFTATDAQIDRLRPGAGQSGLEYLLIEVIDTGVGMDEETLRRAFDPYFTTRGDINATGIGLTVCESIAKAHGGFLVLQSKPGRGTIATFHLPMNATTARPDIFQLRDDESGSSESTVASGRGTASDSSGGEDEEEEGIPGLFSAPPTDPDIATETPSPSPSPSARSVQAPASPPAQVPPPSTFPAAPPSPDAPSHADAGDRAAAAADGDDSDNGFGNGDEGAGRRVLVMEDDAMIRRLVARCLGRAGYDVVETINGQAGLDMHAMARDEGRPFDLVLSDLTIEDGMGGIEMMRELRRRDSKVRAIVSSGYADSPAMARPADYGFDAVLPKPYPPRELLRVVAEALEGGQVGG